MSYNTGVHLGFICSNGDIASDILYTVFMSLKCLVACYVTSTNQTYNRKLISHRTKFFVKMTVEDAANLHSGYHSFINTIMKEKISMTVYRFM